jgi:hypothetical protein
MKTIGTLLLVLACTVTFAQHPLSSKKGANAKNYKASNLKATTIQLFETPSDKYLAGANAKNNLAQEDAVKFTPEGNNTFVRGKGANAKNRHLIIHKLKAEKAKEKEINPKTEEIEEAISK